MISCSKCDASVSKPGLCEKCRLEAAAPDLLEACKKCADMLDKSAWPTVVKILRAAIARATSA